MEFKHISVLLNECIDGLNIKKTGIYIDGTVGGAGHSKHILEKLNGGTLLCIDRDIEALETAKAVLADYEKNNRVILVQENHENIPEIIKYLNIKEVDGILLDLGISSYQIDNKNRGFSYMQNDLLDMRMSQNDLVDAKYIVNNYSEENLVRIFRDYGEEKFSKKIAKEIVKSRGEKEISTTFELNEIIDRVKPFSKKGHKSKQVFQALRMEVNQEVVNLKDSVLKMIQKLKPNGRLAIITFHSLEDRAIKQAFIEAEGKCVCPPSLPICTCNFKSLGKTLTRKPILPSHKELEENTRSHSAKLRIFVKS